MFDKILIANRGEIACRVIRTCRRLGIRTVAVFSEADAAAMHVQMADEAHAIGGPRPADSYLRGDVILEVARRTGAKAIHPGYGFLSENEDFARACEAAGVVFIGPTAEAIEKMGSKSAAKRIMQAAGVPVVPGYHGDEQDAAFLAAEAARVGFPVLIKAVAGGGGKGMRVVHHADEFVSQLDAARREAMNAFKDDKVLIERYVKGPHHIEFQVFGDSHGNALHLFERECSIQRRHQKVLEESPSPFLDQASDGLRERMGEAAVAAVKAIAYRGAGTIEFIVGEDREFFFMEMNTRLQVEHPVTEMITGEDLVEWQLRVAAGEALPLRQSELICGGHAIEVRICAESPENDFLPETGPIHAMQLGRPNDEDVRVDTGVAAGDAVSVFYDSMIAKLITWGEDRTQAIRRMRAALSGSAIVGLKTNLDFLARLVAHDEFIAGRTDTGFIATHRAALVPAQGVPGDSLLAAAVAALLGMPAASAGWRDPWSMPDGWRPNAPARRLIEFKVDGEEAPVECWVTATREGRSLSIDGRSYTFAFRGLDASSILLCLGSARYTATVLQYAERFSINIGEARAQFTLFDPYHYEPADTGNEGRLTALMPGRVVKLLVAAGAKVTKGQALLILEAMKMEHTITSPKDGVIDHVAFKENDLVPADAVLFGFA
jgi:3-methylcrotonyl-CoA carboxylase alpha subunit